MKHPHAATLLQAYIRGIPCLVNPTRVCVIRSYSRADNPYDYYGWTEIEFEVFDRKGYPAPWLEARMTEDDRIAIEERILRAHN